MFLPFIYNAKKEREVKKMRKVLLTLAIVMLAVSPALAFDLGSYVGPLQLEFVNYDVASLYSNVQGTGLADGNQNSFAIVSISSILGANDQILWAKGVSSGDYITGLVYGLDDNNINIAADGTGTIDSIGGKIDLYLNTSDFTPAASAPPGSLTGLSAPADSWNATLGSPFLTLEFIPGVLSPTDYTTTYHQDIFINTAGGAVFGMGNGYLAVTGGSAASIFDDYTYAFNDSFSNLLGDTKGWLVKSDGLAVSTPEPASMILLGLGLLGAARLRRKKA
jgi:hypothetical protein